jgi:D-3-phosphoglycerate dehydrogenase
MTPLIDAATLARLPRGAILINTARGSLIDLVALARALDDGHIAAAGLDTFEPEPYCGPLCAYPQVVLSPHLGSAARETRRRMEQEAAANLAAVLRAHDRGVTQ